MKFTKIKNLMQCGKLLGDVCLATRYHMKELADEFNIFYTSVRVKAAEESKKIVIANNLPLVQPNNLILNNNTDEFYFRPVSSYEIRKIVNSFPSYKAPGWTKSLSLL
ncbi:Hypothetical predicted protein [Paramuricea clavata]|uniref:Uncharacterized protein n=1 Tax=Paramuricea clavata TaxID=317549 RepID=A0A6S7FQ44_PARCT|nr:Hypothetical predicted protein [Paramuricea clavata]